MRFMRKHIAVLAAVGVFFGLLLIPVLANSPTYYDYSQSIVVTNSTGADITTGAARVNTNVSNLVNGGFVGTDGADLYMLNTTGGTQSFITALDFATPVNDTSMWVPIVGLTNGASNSFTLYMGGNTTAADVAQSIFVANASDSIDVVDSTDFHIADVLTVDIDGFKVATLAGGTIITKGDWLLGTVNASGDVTVTASTLPTASAADLTGNNADATFGGDATYTSVSGGKFYYGAEGFDGTGDYVSFGSAAVLDDLFSGGGTIEVWYDASATGNNLRILTKAANAGSFSGGWALLSYAALCGAGTEMIWFYQDFTSTDGSWRSDGCVLDTSAGYQHIAVTYDNSSTANNPIFYIDGSSVALTEQSTPAGSAVSDASNTAALSSLFTGAGYGAPGAYDDVRFWGDIRSAGEISANYNQELTGAEADLQGYWPFNTGAGTDTVTVLGQVAANTATDILFTFTGGTASLTVGASTTTDATWGATISTNTTDLALLDDFATIGWADRIRIGDTSLVSPTYVLDLQFEPDQIDETQAGTSGNGWIWQGNVFDQSASENNATYTFKRDTTDINVTVGPVTTTAAAAAPSTETNPTIVSGNVDTVSNPFTEGTAVSDFGFPLNLLATSAQAGSIPLMWFAGTFTIGLAALIGFITFRGTKTPAWTILSVMIALGALIWMTPIANGVIYLVVPVCLALVMLIPRSFEAVE